MLVDRVGEADVLERLLASVRDGLSGALVLRGQAGIGKTALLDWMAGQADDMQLARLTGIESEMDLGFAGLHQLLIPFLGGLKGLPGAQREALGAAFGLVGGPAPDRFLVGLGALTLITEAAADRPVLCVIDDAQWLDRVSVEVLGFVARRLFADQVGMVFAMRPGERRTLALEGLTEVAVSALPEEAALELLSVSAGRPVDSRVGTRIVAETAGNPLALVEFGGELTAAEAAGSAPLPEPLRFGAHLEELYQSRVLALPAEARMLLLVAAADQLGDPRLVWRAAARLGIDPEVASLPAVERLMTWSPTVRFRHPLMRSAAYYTASTPARRRAHEALAVVSDPGRDPDRRAWHLAEAASAPDERVAAELERSANRARSRGGWASGAVFLEQAAALTPDPARQAQRLLDAAENRLVAGETLTARALLERAAPQLADPSARARARRLEGLIFYAAGQMPEATSVLVDAARMLGESDPRLARDTLLNALAAAQWSSASSAGMAEVLQAVRSAPKVADAEATVADLLLDGNAAEAEQRFDAAAALLRRAIAPLTASQGIPDDVLPHFVALATATSVLMDDAARHHLEHRWVAELRDRGAIGAMLAALAVQASVQVEEGRFADAEATLAEGRALSDATGYQAYQHTFRWEELYSLACRGQEADARSLARQLLSEAAGQDGEDGYPDGVDLSLTVLELGLGNYADALRHARVLFRDGATGFGWVEVVEAGTRSGDREAAAAALAAFTPRALAGGTHLALGWLARCRALLADDEHAEAEYQLAIEHLRQCRVVPELARAHLLYGEWLRRQRRRRAARDQLRAAWQTFDALGMEAFAERARGELRATGEHVPKRTVETRDALTPQEAQIARLAAEGLTNGEIAARLFISAGTVDYHLNKVFRKLGITSRVRLAYALS